jgi:hypothetical protein
MDNNQDTARLEGKKSTWWLWLLLALILLGLIAYALGKNKDKVEEKINDASNQTQQQVQTQTPDTTIRSIPDALTAFASNSATGRNFNIQNAKVTKVTGDTTFWVNTGSGDEVFVELKNNLDAGSAEQQVKVVAGQTVDISGVVRNAPNETDIKTMWGFNDADALNLKNRNSYLEAQTISIR